MQHKILSKSSQEMLKVFVLLETDKFSQRLRAGLVADILKNLLEDLNQLGLDFWGHAAQGAHSNQLPYGGVPLYRVNFERPVSLK